MGFEIILEKFFEFGLIENNDCAVDNGNLVIFGHTNSNFSREGLKTLAIQFPATAALKSGTGGNTLGDIKSFVAGFATWIGKLGDDALDFLKTIIVIAKGIDIFIFVFD